MNISRVPFTEKKKRIITKEQKEQRHEYMRTYKRRPEIKEKYRQYRITHKEWYNIYQTKYLLQLRMNVLYHYGGNPPKCACCGVDHIEFLCIDHINGGGNKHRKEINLFGGHNFYRWLIKNNYPSGFQVLCFNCNSSKAHYGYCPHDL